VTALLLVQYSWRVTCLILAATAVGLFTLAVVPGPRPR